MSEKCQVRCVVCENGIMTEEVGAVSYRVEDNLITVFNAPIFWCDGCNATTYRKGLGVNEALEEACKRGANVILYRDEDWMELRK